MSILQVSEKEIRTYQTLDDYLGKTLEHNESSLYYKDKIVYKILNQIWRLSRQRYMWILDQYKFDNCINIENLLYQGDKLIGCTTKFDDDFESLVSVMHEKEFKLYEAKEILQSLLYTVDMLLQHDLAYIDMHPENVGMSNGNLMISDLDGVWYKADEGYKQAAYKKTYYIFLHLIFNTPNDKIFLKHNEAHLCNILGIDNLDIKTLDALATNMTQMQAEVIQSNYYQRILKI